MKKRSFKAFLEEKENPYLSSLEDELGIDIKDLKNEPQIASFYSFGKTIQNIGSYKILNFKRNEKGEITHAVVKQANDPVIKNRKYKEKDGSIEREKENLKKDDQVFIVQIKDLDKLLSQDFMPPPAM
jgi:hypothetical protein